MEYAPNVTYTPFNQINDDVMYSINNYTVNLFAVISLIYVYHVCPLEVHAWELEYCVYRELAKPAK